MYAVHTNVCQHGHFSVLLVRGHVGIVLSRGSTQTMFLYDAGIVGKFSDILSGFAFAVTSNFTHRVFIADCFIYMFRVGSVIYIHTIHVILYC